MAIPNSLKPTPLPPLPIGFKFRPSDKVLLAHYLYKKVAGPAYSDPFVRECDIYGEQEPWEIWRDFGGGTKADSEDLHFFTKLKAKTTNGSRKDRTIGRGTWKGEDSGTQVWGDRDHTTKERKLLGLKKRFRYETGKGGAPRPKLDARWIMFQYALDAASLPPSYEAKNYVLCVLRRLKNQKRKADERYDYDEPIENIAGKRLETEDVAPFYNYCIGYGGASTFTNPSVEPCSVADGSQAQYQDPIPAHMAPAEGVGDADAENVELYDMVMKELELEEEGQKGRPLVIEIEDSDEDVEDGEKDESVIIDVEEYDNVKSGANVVEPEQEAGGGDNNLRQEDDLSWLEEIDFSAFEGGFQDVTFDSFFADVPESSFDISACGSKAAAASASPSLGVAAN